MHDSWNMIVCCDKDWTITTGIASFYGKKIIDVMNWVKGQCDTYEHSYTMEVIFLPQDCYRIIFTFVD